jgi:hypothetical protein
MKLKHFVLASTVAFSGLATHPATAAIYAFDLTGGKTASFTIDTSVTPDFFSSGPFGNQVSYNNIAGTFGGTAQTAAIGFGSNIFAQLNIGGTTLGFTQYGGPDLFTLMGTTPVFNLGTFNLSSITSGAAQIRISAVNAAAVPETATWGMMIAGFGMMGAALRTRRRSTKVTFA